METPTPLPPTTLIPDLFPGMTYDEAVNALKGKTKEPTFKAVVQILRLSREDVLNASLDIGHGERAAGFYAGAANALRELERCLVSAAVVPQ